MFLVATAFDVLLSGVMRPNILFLPPLGSLRLKTVFCQTSPEPCSARPPHPHCEHPAPPGAISPRTSLPFVPEPSSANCRLRLSSIFWCFPSPTSVRDQKRFFFSVSPPSVSPFFIFVHEILASRQSKRKPVLSFFFARFWRTRSRSFPKFFFSFFVSLISFPLSRLSEAVA